MLELKVFSNEYVDFTVILAIRDDLKNVAFDRDIFNFSVVHKRKLAVPEPNGTVSILSFHNYLPTTECEVKRDLYEKTSIYNITNKYICFNMDESL